MMTPEIAFRRDRDRHGFFSVLRDGERIGSLFVRRFGRVWQGTVSLGDPSPIVEVDSSRRRLLDRLSFTLRGLR